MRRVCLPEHPFLAQHLPFVARDLDLNNTVDYTLDELWDRMMLSRSLSHEADGVHRLDLLCWAHSCANQGLCKPRRNDSALALNCDEFAPTFLADKFCFGETDRRLM